MSIDKALEMMQLAQRAGFFEATPDDPGKIESFIVAEPGKANYEDLIVKALIESAFDNEWKKSAAIICNQSCGNWRKIMLVNLKSGKVTFRSLTSDSAYLFARNELSADDWHLDRAMLDAHPAAFLLWLSYLQSI